MRENGGLGEEREREREEKEEKERKRSFTRRFEQQDGLDRLLILQVDHFLRWSVVNFVRVQHLVS